MWNICEIIMWNYYYVKYKGKYVKRDKIFIHLSSLAWPNYVQGQRGNKITEIFGPDSKHGGKSMIGNVTFLAT